MRDTIRGETIGPKFHNLQVNTLQELRMAMSIPIGPGKGRLVRVSGIYRLQMAAHLVRWEMAGVDERIIHRHWPIEIDRAHAQTGAQ